jgi:ribosome maturation factor RimP
MQQTSQPSTKAGIDLDRIRTALAPMLAAHGVSLVDIEWLTERAGWTLRLTIEREETATVSLKSNPVHGGGLGAELGLPSGAPIVSGVTLEDCAEVSRAASAVLDDVEDLIPQHYNLEVSSPGLDRRLRTAADFERFLGRTAKVKLSRPAPDGQRLLRGKLESAPPGLVAVIVDGKRIEAPLADVEEARLVFELETQQKPAGRRGVRPDKPGSPPEPPKGARPSKAKSGKEPRGSKRR